MTDGEKNSFHKIYLQTGTECVEIKGFNINIVKLNLGIHLMFSFSIQLLTLVGVVGWCDGSG